jgi:hypothetical protein
MSIPRDVPNKEPLHKSPRVRLYAAWAGFLSENCVQAAHTSCGWDRVHVEHERIVEERIAEALQEERRSSVGGVQNAVTAERLRIIRKCIEVCEAPSPYGSLISRSDTIEAIRALLAFPESSKVFVLEERIQTLEDVLAIVKDQELYNLAARDSERVQHKDTRAQMFGDRANALRYLHATLEDMILTNKKRLKDYDKGQERA